MASIIKIGKRRRFRPELGYLQFPGVVLQALRIAFDVVEMGPDLSQIGRDRCQIIHGHGTRHVLELVSHQPAAICSGPTRKSNQILVHCLSVVTEDKHIYGIHSN